MKITDPRFVYHSAATHGDVRNFAERLKRYEEQQKTSPKSIPITDALKIVRQWNCV